MARLRFLRSAAPKHVEARGKWLLAAVAAAVLMTTAPARVARARTTQTVPRALQPVAIGVANDAEIWIVEASNDHDTYSNGLRIDNRYSIGGHPRSYPAFPADDPGAAAKRRSDPAGIVFHTTESQQASFEPDENAHLQRIGESLLEYVKAKRSYNFVIDRFGRVFRVVREENAANHAGYSVWSDDSYVYLNLNESFIGVAFETQTPPGQDEATVAPAQVHSAALLTAMLRRRYGIPAQNCVTHGQVSVNVSNFRIGYHLDWASGFPFAQIGLPDNYAAPLPSVAVFGFEYDAGFARRAGERLFQEAETGNQVLLEHAAAAHRRASVYRHELQQRFRAELGVRDDGGPE